MGAFDFMKKLTSFGQKEKAIEFFQDERNNIIPFQMAMGLGNDKVRRTPQEYIHNGYAHGTDVKPVVDKIAATAASLKWKVYTKDRQGNIEEAPDSDLQKLLIMPNKEQTWHDYMEASIIQLLVTGNAFTSWETAIGFGDVPIELHLLTTQGFTPILSTNDMLLGYEYEMGSMHKKFRLDELIQVKYYNPTDRGYIDGLGLSPLDAAINAYTTSNNQWLAASSLLKNKGAIGMVTPDSDDILTEEELDQAQEALQRRMGGADKFGKVMVTPTKMRYQAMGMTASDMKIIEMGIMNLRAICNIYGVDSSLFNDPSNKTFNNRKEAEKALWTNVNLPILDKFKFQYNKTLAKAYSEREGKEYFIDYVTDDIQALHEDKDKQADRVVKLIQSGVIKPSKGAEMMGIEVDDQEEEQIIQALNGAQVTSMVQVATAVAEGTLPKQSAIEILVISFGVTRQQAEGVINGIEVKTRTDET